jgi:hypothetical protein
VTDSAFLFGVFSSRSECKDLVNLRVEGSGPFTKAALETEGIHMKFHGVDIICSTRDENGIQCRNAKI